MALEFLFHVSSWLTLFFHLVTFVFPTTFNHLFIMFVASEVVSPWNSISRVLQAAYHVSLTEWIELYWYQLWRRFFVGRVSLVVLLMLQNLCQERGMCIPDLGGWKLNSDGLACELEGAWNWTNLSPFVSSKRDVGCCK